MAKKKKGFWDKFFGDEPHLKPFEKVMQSGEGKRILRQRWRVMVRAQSLDYWKPTMYQRIWTWYWMKHDYPKLDDELIGFLLPAVILSHGKQAPSPFQLHGEVGSPENVNPNLGM